MANHVDAIALYAPNHCRVELMEEIVAAKKAGAPVKGVLCDKPLGRNVAEARKICQLAEEAGLKEKADAMFRGDKINLTEGRSVLHMALRTPKGKSIVVDGKDVMPDVHAVLDKMAAFADKFRAGEWKGHTGKRIKNVVNIGIGGSDLGPVMAYEALRHYAQRNLAFRYVPKSPAPTPLSVQWAAACAGYASTPSPSAKRPIRGRGHARYP
jgi:glucose-6-phosphate isomerase